jgi:tetratricopeptide (TPR) repeat protein
MDANPLLSKALALEPVELSTPGGDAARTAGNESSANAKAQRDLHITTADEFLAEAAREYQKGHINSALWRRAADQCGDDASLVIAAYLRARATALQLQQKQDERSQRQARRAGSMRGASDRKVESEPRLEIVSAKVAGVRPQGVKPKLKYLAAVAAALASVGAVVWLIASPRESESVRQPIVSAAAPSPNRSAPPTPLGSEQPLVKSTSGGTNQGGPDPTLETTVQQLKNDGKWNVLVLYASEWARKEPNNAAAWYELSVGYAKLRQFEDAFAAATKAVQLSPGDSLLWRNLGHVNLAVERLPEAGIAFDRALAVTSDDADALCGAALVAQRQGRPKDADAIARRAKSVDGSCPGVSDGESVAVVAGRSAARKPVLSVGR